MNIGIIRPAAPVSTHPAPSENSGIVPPWLRGGGRPPAPTGDRVTLPVKR